MLKFIFKAFTKLIKAQISRNENSTEKVIIFVIIFQLYVLKKTLLFNLLSPNIYPVSHLYETHACTNAREHSHNVHLPASRRHKRLAFKRRKAGRGFIHRLRGRRYERRCRVFVKRPRILRGAIYASPRNCCSLQLRPDVAAKKR